MNIKNIFLTLICLIINSTNTTDHKTVFLFSHGIADTYKQAFQFAQSYIKDSVHQYNEHYLFTGPWASFNYPDATEGRLRVNYYETSFGQENELNRLNHSYQKTIQWAEKQWDAYNLVLVGLSRGASNVAIFAGLHSIDKVKAIILESPYYTMTEVIESIMKKCNMGLLPVSYGETIAEFIFKKYKRNGMSPATMIHTIPKHIPVLIICSQEDHLVPCSSSINVYKKLVESGHQHAYLLLLDHGRHSKLLSGADGKKYQDTVHAFYKKYNLPHDPSMAANGQENFLLCQPFL